MDGILVFIYGLIFGSFFNVVGLRVPVSESIIAPPSHCTKCQTKLKILDLIPVLSYLFFRGQCRYCQTSISPIYPFFEVLTGLLFFVGYKMFGLTSMFVLFSLLVSLLIIITISDLAYRIIPDKVLLVFFLLFLMNQAVFQPITWKDSLLGFVISFTVLYIIAVISKGGIGGGDIKLFAVIGIVLGWQGFIINFLLAFIFGAIYGIVVIIKSHGKINEIVFGPFIAMAAIVSFLWNEELIEWYLRLF